MRNILGGAAGQDGREGTDRRDSVTSRSRSTRAVALETGRHALTSAIRGIRTALRRPTASDVAMGCCTLAIGTVVGSTLVGRRLAVLATVAGLAAALATVLLASDRPLVRGLGAVVAVPVAVPVSASMLFASALAMTSSGVGAIAGLTVWTLVVAAFAAGLVAWRRFGRGGVRRGSTGAMLAAIGVAIVVVVPVLPRADLRARALAAVGDVIGAAWDGLVAAEGSVATVSFAGLVLVAAGCSSRALAVLPVERLVPPDRRDSLATTIAEFRRGCSITIRGAIATLVGAVGAPVVVDRLEGPVLTPTDLRTTLPTLVGEAVAALVTTAGVRLVLIALAGIAFGLVVLEWGRRVLGRGPSIVVARLVAPIAGGALVGFVLARALADPSIEADLEAILRTALEGRAPAAVVDVLVSAPASVLVAAVLVAALVGLSSFLRTVTMLRAVRVLPERAISGALAAGAIFVLAVGLAVVGRLEPAIWTTAGAFVLWDIGEYADGVRTELGRDAATMRAELVHVGGTLLTGGVVAGGTVALSRWGATAFSITDPTLAAVAVGAGLFAVVLVAWVVRA